MRINQVEDYSTNSEGSIIVPCIESNNLAALLNEIAPGTVDNAPVKCDADEVISILKGVARIEIIGIKSSSFTDVQKALQVFVSKNYKRIGTHVHLYLKHISNPEVVEAAVNGTVLGTYDPGLYKTNGNGRGEVEQVSAYTSGAMQDAINRGYTSAETQKSIFGLVNAPSNYKSPQTLADWATKSGKEHDYVVTIIEKEELTKNKFDALLAVNRGSEEPARFIICDYNPGNAVKTIALVGKGVTFDTGGLSIKPSNNMHYMKSDMGGAAAVLGAVELIAKRKLPVRVIGFIPSTDNSVDALAIKPGDVIGSYSGQTIEVLNTDAEGRLVLADGLAYAIKNYSPDVVIDLATLTGSIVRTLGSYCAGLFTQNDDLAAALISAGQNTGEKLWRLPMWDEYADEMKSEIADIKNLSEKPTAGSITAAKFLEHFTSNHPNWAHIDIAGTAFKANGVSRSHTATAFGVRLLCKFVEEMN
jgi:leucyl aminopeptidase